MGAANITTTKTLQNITNNYEPPTKNNPTAHERLKWVYNRFTPTTAVLPKTNNHTKRPHNG